MIDPESWDKLENWKRWLLVPPIEIAVIVLAIIMAWQGQAKDALTVLVGIFGIMIGYYFGTHKPPEQA